MECSDASILLLLTPLFAIDPILVLTRLWYATLRLRPAYAETGGVARLRPLTRSTPRQASFSLHHERSSDATRLRAVRPNRPAWA